MIFNRKDALQDAFLAQHFNLQDALYPRHFVPAVDAFELALELGLGWGMVPELMLAARTGRAPLQEVLPGHRSTWCCTGSTGRASRWPRSA